MKKNLAVLIAVIATIFLHFNYVEGSTLCFFGSVADLTEDSKSIHPATTQSNFLKTNEFDFIYKNLPETGTTPKDFASFTADPKFQKIFQSHFKKIKLINCRNFHKNQPSDKPRRTPQLFSTELYSGPAALKLAQEGKKVVVLIFADSTNVGGIYLTKKRQSRKHSRRTNRTYGS